MILSLQPSTISSPCPLLSAEQGTDYCETTHMHVPQHSAWAAQQIDLLDFTDANGDVSLPGLEAAIRAVVDAGDRMHDRSEWNDPLQEYDSWLNRRLAIVFRGWGDLVQRRRLDPGTLETLREIEQLAEWCNSVARRYSRDLAQRLECCPALDETGAGVLQRRPAAIWDAQWSRAAAAVALRHRNLTSLSPWDVFPRHRPADWRYADLLPVIRFADSTSFHCDVTIDRWNASDFHKFQSRVNAILRCSKGAGLIAQRV